jgi:hypothetical protein
MRDRRVTAAALIPATQPRLTPLPREDAALILPVSLVASGQIGLRRIDGWAKIAEVLGQHTAA